MSDTAVTSLMFLNNTSLFLGANYIERHITLDRTMWGTDQAASLAEPGMRSLS